MGAPPRPAFTRTDVTKAAKAWFNKSKLSPSDRTLLAEESYEVCALLYHGIVSKISTNQTLTYTEILNMIKSASANCSSLHDELSTLLPYADDIECIAMNVSRLGVCDTPPLHPIDIVPMEQFIRELESICAVFALTSAEIDARGLGRPENIILNSHALICANIWWRIFSGRAREPKDVFHGLPFRQHVKKTAAFVDTAISQKFSPEEIERLPEWCSRDEDRTPNVDHAAKRARDATIDRYSRQDGD